MEEKIWYTIRETFNVNNSEKWINYINWSGLKQCKEIISLDYMLCPNIVAIDDSESKKWDYVLLQNNIVSDLYSDVDYILSKTDKSKNAIIYAVQLITEKYIEKEIKNFEFIGYDLVDKNLEISAITNCGGFPETFDNKELNQYGLINTFERAKEIQKNLIKNNPDEYHAECDIWKISIKRDIQQLLQADKNFVFTA